jgi:hypothetical protein
MAWSADRVAHLEGRVEEQVRMVDGIRDSVTKLEQRMDRRFEVVDRRFDGIDRRLDAMDRRLDVMDAKISRHFFWLVGIQLTTLTAIVTAIAAR